MARKLVELWDPAMKIPDLSEAEVVSGVRAHNRDRLLTVVAVGEFKRRLSKASDGERARDKQLARAAGGAIGNVIMICDRHEVPWTQMWDSFREEARNNLGCRQAAAVLQFPQWLTDMAAAQESEAVWCAGWVLAHNTQSTIVRALVRQLDNCRDRLVQLSVNLVA